MNNNVEYNLIMEFISALEIRHESSHFKSGAIMLDIWHKGNFYVVQFEDDFIGFSEITAGNIGFDTIPDEKFYDSEKLKQKLETVFR